MPTSIQGPYLAKEAKPGTRLFDVKMQGKLVIENLDIVAAAEKRNNFV